MSINWDDFFMEMCHTISKKSKDTVTKLGSVIVGPDNEVRSIGYNSFPRGINDYVPIRFERPEKYNWFVHAEANAIFNAARMGTPIKDCKIYIPWHPCNTCMMGIIQSGIYEVIIEDSTIPDRWRDLFTVSAVMANEAGVNIRVLERESINKE